jgi:hypothetical protein
MLQTAYVFSAVGYLLFPEDYVVEDEKRCSTLYQCYLTTLNHGICRDVACMRESGKRGARMSQGLVPYSLNGALQGCAAAAVIGWR